MEIRMKKLNKLTTMILVVIATLFISHCWKQRHVIEAVEGGNIEKAIESKQY
jgi:hypothetical protein